MQGNTDVVHLAVRPKLKVEICRAPAANGQAIYYAYICGPTLGDARNGGQGDSQGGPSVTDAVRAATANTVPAPITTHYKIISAPYDDNDAMIAAYLILFNSAFRLSMRKVYGNVNYTVTTNDNIPLNVILATPSITDLVAPAADV